MLNLFFNWKVFPAILALSIIMGSIFYSNYLSNKIEKDERAKVQAFAESLKLKGSSVDPGVIFFTNKIAEENKEIPIIATDEKDNILDFQNLDTTLAKTNSKYLNDELYKFKQLHVPVQVTLTDTPFTYNKYFYGNSKILNEVRYYPLLQLLIIGLFTWLMFLLVQSNYKSTQNQVWAGMAKETAHQLGTPVSSIEGWVEMLKENNLALPIANELDKDVNKLRLISDRFGKIGSKPQVENVNLVEHIHNVTNYMRKRATGKIKIEINSLNKSTVMAKISPTLFDWVMENLIKNSLDAIEGKGKICIDVFENNKSIIIDVNDNGKGIMRQNWNKVFKPGYSTKKRGWGLGLSLAKRIITQYHEGQIFVKNSEPMVSTTIRVILKK